MGYLSDVAIVTVCQHPTFLVPLLRMDLWSIFSNDTKKCQQRGEIKMCKIHMDLNVVDHLTKALPQPKHEAHLRSMGIRYLRD